MSNQNSAKSSVMTFLAGAAAGSIALAYLTRPKKQDPATKAKQHLSKIVEYSLTGGLIRVCDKLQLYDALWESGPSTAAELAQKLNCSERWLTELLSQATAAGICVYFFGKFCLKPEYAHLLRDPAKSTRSMQGMFDMVPCLLARTDATVESVKSGIGVDYDYHGGDILTAIDRKNANWFQNILVDEVLKNVKVPKTEKGLIEMLEAGIQVADIGCGLGASALAMAKRFPKSHFCCYESSKVALKTTQERATEANLTNVTVYDAAKRTVVAGSANGKKFDFIYAHDVVHDMTNPKAFIKEAKKCLSDDGCMVIVDMACSENLKENIAMPDAALRFGYSSFLCLACSTCKKNGAGLGICGFPEAVARRWTKEEGFEFFETMEIESLPMNSCFIVA